MDRMLGVVRRTPICLRELLSDFQAALENDKPPRSREDIMAAMKLEKEQTRFETTEANCRLDQLEQFDDVRVMNYTPGSTEAFRRPSIPNDALKLQTFKILLEEKQKNVKNPFERTRHSFKSVKLPECADKMLSDYKEILIYIRVYRPARATHQGQRLEKPVFAEEFQCLGRNLLTDLRDRISCVCNKKRFFDISEHPTDELIDKKTDPGYFFITDTFYNDKRNPANADYSQTVRDWTKNAEGLRELEFKVAEMEKTRFIDLTISLGFPQLYHHHGNCEHVFVFSQIEFITPFSRVGDPSMYPLLSSYSSFNMRSCNMCGQRSYVFIVEESIRQLHDPAYLCAKCFYSFHYLDGQKIGKFKAYKVNDYDEEEEQLLDSDAAVIDSTNDQWMEEQEDEEEEEQNSLMQATISDQTIQQSSFEINTRRDQDNLLTALEEPQLSDVSEDEVEFVAFKKEKED